MTPSLFHGPEARDRAVLLSEEIGRPVSDPIGDAGLSVEDSRRIVEIANQSGVGDKPPSVVIGPIDGVKSLAAADALLKTLEDLTDAPLRIILWADYLSGVRDTIRSRTLAVWCPPSARYISPVAHLLPDAKSLCEALLEESPSRILGVIEDHDKAWSDLFQALLEPLSESYENPKCVEAWLRIRPLLDGRGSVLSAANALLPETV